MSARFHLVFLLKGQSTWWNKEMWKPGPVQTFLQTERQKHGVHSCDVQAGAPWGGAHQPLISGTNLLKHCNTWMWLRRRAPDGHLCSHCANILKEGFELAPKCGIMRNGHWDHNQKSYKNMQEQPHIKAGEGFYILTETQPCTVAVANEFSLYFKQQLFLSGYTLHTAN